MRTEIKYHQNEPIEIQINLLKKQLIETNVILGKDFTFEIASLIAQIEKLINYYDTKKLPARYRAGLKALNLTLSKLDERSKFLSEINDQLELLNTKFDNVQTNAEKRSIMFQLLFLHVNVLLNAYCSKEFSSKNGSLNKILEDEVSEPLVNKTEDINPITASSDTSLVPMTEKQRMLFRKHITNYDAERESPNPRLNELSSHLNRAKNFCYNKPYVLDESLKLDLNKRKKNLKDYKKELSKKKSNAK